MEWPASVPRYNVGVQLLDPDPAVLGRAIRDLRRAVGLTQRELAARSGFSQSLVAAVELGQIASVSIPTVQRLLGAMGARFEVRIDAPVLVDRRGQADRAHARCVTYVAGHLERAGWLVATEVEIGRHRSPGWVDVLAWHPGTQVLLVTEVKTEIHDVGAIERALAWYERESGQAGRARGWHPRLVVGALLVLGTEAVEARLRENRASFDRSFPARSRDLAALITSGWPTGSPRRYLAMIDPMSRRADWLRPLRIDGRRSPAPHADYAAFVRARHERSRAHRGRPGPVPTT